MLLNKQNILNRINQMQATFRVKWEDIKTDLDLAIDKINDYMGTKYPHVTEILNDFAPFKKPIHIVPVEPMLIFFLKNIF